MYEILNYEIKFSTCEYRGKKYLKIKYIDHLTLLFHSLKYI